VLATLGAYVALTKPRIIWLLLFTTVPAMVVAAEGWPGGGLVGATLLGGMLAAGGANAINQYADRDIDRLMSRTSGRPLVRGTVPPLHAVVLGLLLSVISVAWMVATVNVLAAALTAGAIAFYVGAYTYVLKRTTTQNIVIGGAAGAAPPMIGWAAVTGNVEVEAALLFLIVFYWTPPHFWALSLLLKDDYERAGVPMLPVVRGELATKRQILLYTLLLLPLTLIFGAVAELNWIYFATAVVGGAGFLWFARALLIEPGIDRARGLFRFSVLYLALLFASMAADELLLG
jgi:protoheme IX farnesyltransferase